MQDSVTQYSICWCPGFHRLVSLSSPLTYPGISICRTRNNNGIALPVRNPHLIRFNWVWSLLVRCLVLLDTRYHQILVSLSEVCEDIMFVYAGLEIPKILFCLSLTKIQFYQNHVTGAPKKNEYSLSLKDRKSGGIDASSSLSS